MTMDSNDKCIVNGFRFGSKKDADLAREEEKKILYIGAKLNYDDPQSVLVIYNKMIQNRIFLTQIGFQFLKEVEDFLIESQEVDDFEILPIPLSPMFMEDEEREEILPRIQAKKKKPDSYRVRYNAARIVIAMLLVCIVSMFFITLNADNPNILNYKHNIENKYAAWEQELTEREAVVREKERELENSISQ